MTDRIPLDDMTSDQVDQLYDELDRLRAAVERVRNLAGRIRQGAPWTANDDDIAAHIVAALDGQAPAASCSPAAPETEPNNPAATEAADIETTARVFAALHRSAEETVTRVIDLYERWVKAGPPPLGVPMSRWWDRRLVELRAAIRGAVEQPAGTTVKNPPADEDDDLTGYITPAPPIGCLNLGQPKED